MADLDGVLASRGLTDDPVAIESLARDANRPTEEVREIYRLERASLELTARVKAFIPVLVSRRVRNILRSQDLDQLQPQR